MRSKIIVLLACICCGQAFSQQAFDQDELRSWVPAHPGDTWVYQNESSPKVDRWRTEETVTRLIGLAEGTIVVRRIRVLDGTPPVAEPKEQAWLIHGDCLYDLTPAEWDAGHPNQLSAAFTAMPPWAGGEHERVFCFPLIPGKTWGKESGHEWHVAEVTDQDPSSPDKRQTFHVSAQIGPGLTEDVWFERGLGIVRENDVHAGTNQERRTQLLLFEPAPTVAEAIGRAPAPTAEVGVRWAYNSLSTSTSSGESNQNGGSIYGEYFFKKAAHGWIRRGLFGLVADFSRSGSNSGGLYTYLLRPRFSLESRHLASHFEPIVGGAHVQVNGTAPAGLPASAMRNSFAWGLGFGLDYLAGRHYVVTLYQWDIVVLQVPDVGSGTSHWWGDTRISAGIGFRFGQR